MGIEPTFSELSILVSESDVIAITLTSPRWSAMKIGVLSVRTKSRQPRKHEKRKQREQKLDPSLLSERLSSVVFLVVKHLNNFILR